MMSHSLTLQQIEAAARRVIRMAFQEDLADGVDLTTWALVDPQACGTVDLIARASGVAAGLITIPWVFDELKCRQEMTGLDVACTLRLQDGETISPGACLARLTGSVRLLLVGERPLLNLLMHLSGIASLTACFVTAVEGLPVKILDTRKTLPGWRMLEKYAVRCGGGTNHRLGLYDGVLIKDNHLAFAAEARRTMADSIHRTRQFAPPRVLIEVEVDTLSQLDEALRGGADIVLLDNMTGDQLREAVKRRNSLRPDVLLEASGGITLDTVRSIAETGIDRISIGALTHSAAGLDLGFDWSGD